MVIDTVCTATTQIAAGYYHTLTLKSDGTLWAWGWNDHGQLGDGSTTDKHSPAQVSAFRIWRLKKDQNLSTFDLSLLVTPHLSE